MLKLIESITEPLQVASPKKLSGIFAVTNIFNQNSRRYPDSVYREAYEKIAPKIESRRLLGELDHPIDRDEVFLSNVSHVITECKVRKDSTGNTTYYGTVELLDTPAGQIAQALVRAGVPLGISSRGVGNTKQVSGGSEVTQLTLITYDLVAEPSFSIAILSDKAKSELSESLSNIESRIPLNESRKDHEDIRDRINSIRKSLKLTKPRVHIENTNLQTMEVSALKSVLESKMRVIDSDTKRLKEFRQRDIESSNRIKELETNLNRVRTRYTTIQENHSRLQDAYNELDASWKKKLNEELLERDSQIAELRKRLAVEQRGMSYSKVCDLLEGVSTEEDINNRLDSIARVGYKSVELDSSRVNSIKESLSSFTPTNERPLSKIISRV